MQMSGRRHGRRAQLRDAVEITLPVYRYTTPEVVGTSGRWRWTRPGWSWCACPRALTRRRASWT